MDDIISQESKAERSLMHRFNIALVRILLHSDTVYPSYSLNSGSTPLERAWDNHAVHHQGDS